MGIKSQNQRNFCLLGKQINVNQTWSSSKRSFGLRMRLRIKGEYSAKSFKSQEFGANPAHYFSIFLRIRHQRERAKPATKSQTVANEVEQVGDFDK